MAVSQDRLFSVMAAQIFAAAAASRKGPATSRNCMPKPPEPSLITMIGRSSASGALARDLSSPRHSARKPAIELALPTSTPNSVRWIFGSGTSAASCSASSADGAAATTSGIGAAEMTLMGLSGSISLLAAGSGGAIIDFDSTSGVAGVTAGLLPASLLEPLLFGASLFSASLFSASLFSASLFSASLAMLETFAGAGSAVAEAGAFSAGAAGVVTTGPTTGAGGAP